jgi:organic radical activating enzyme
MLQAYATSINRFDAGEASPISGLRFLWLELTNVCNLHCTHCYAESGPHPDRADLLSTADFKRLLREAADIGCRAVQFIGGEATLHPGLPQLIAYARHLEYEFVEVYTNATRLPSALLACFVQHSVSLAVSIYADEAAVHDTVTRRRGSHVRTIANVKKLVDAGLDVRVGVIAMDANAGRIEPTLAFIRDLGVQRVAVDQARGIGRGADVTRGEAGLQALCGSCWKGKLCIAPDGVVSTCIMSKAWPVGTVLDSGLADLVESASLRDVRQMIRDRVWEPRHAADRDDPTMCEPSPCNPDGCPPDLICHPSDPPCQPDNPYCVPDTRLSHH